jgi:hypothetical protein
MSNSKLCVIFCCFFLWRILLHRESKKTVKDESQGKKFHPTNRHRMGTGKYPRHPLTYPRPSTQKDRTSVLHTPWTSDAQWEWCFLVFSPFCFFSLLVFEVFFFFLRCPLQTEQAHNNESGPSRPTGQPDHSWSAPDVLTRTEIDPPLRFFGVGRIRACKICGCR